VVISHLLLPSAQASLNILQAPSIYLRRCCFEACPLYIIPCDTPTNMILVMQHEHPTKSVPSKAHRVMMSAKPSTHGPAEPEIPPMLYPRGGMSVCLQKSVHVWSCLDNHLPATTVCVSVPLALPPQAGQDLDAIDPQARSQAKTEELLSLACVESKIV
jgi:hypothetical protein